MGPNSLRLLDELIEKTENTEVGRVLDLGCGLALTSLFIANETDSKSVYAFDLWIPASENYSIIKNSNLDDKVIPIHGDALNMPFAKEYFDTIISVDAFHFFGCEKGILSEKILPFVKKGGYVMMTIPGIKMKPEGELEKLFATWAEGDDADHLKTIDWWQNHMKEECGDNCDVIVEEAKSTDKAWSEWFESGHEYGMRDKEFIDKGLNKVLNFILIYIRKKI